MTKNNVFVGKRFCNQELFVLNISEVINGNSLFLLTWLISIMYVMLN